MAGEKTPLIARKRLTGKKFCCYYGFCATVLLFLSITIASIFGALYFFSKANGACKSSSVTTTSPAHGQLDRVLALSPNVNVCTTAVCVELAAEILSSIDETKSPCDDFYDFACGKWEQSHYLPPGTACSYMCERLYNNNIITSTFDVGRSCLNSNENWTLKF